MPSTTIIALVLAGPLPVEAAISLRSPEALQQDYRDALQDSARRAQPDYAEVVPRLAKLYVELAMAERLSHSEREQMQGRLKVRLEEIYDRLLREQAALEKAEARARYRAAQDPDSTRRRTRPPGSSEALAGGGTTARNAQQLIDIIQNTIAPESWDVHGGRGSIRYYGGLFQVLVVRQTGEVHHQLGGVLGQLRKAQ